MNMTMNMTTLPEPAGNEKPALQAAWHFAKQELLYLCWALMDTAVITPLLLLAMPWARFWPVSVMTLWVLLLILLPFNLARLMSALGIRPARQRLLLIVIFFFILLLGWRMVLFAPRAFWELGWLGTAILNIGSPTDTIWSRQFILFLAVLVGFWRGLRLVGMRPEIRKIGLRLRLGAVAFGVIAVIAISERPFWSPVGFILLYYLVGLTAVALVRAEQVEFENTGMFSGVSPRWVGIVALTSLIITSAAGIFTLLLTNENAGRVASWGAPIWTAILLGTAVVLRTLGYLFSPLLFVFGLLLELLITLLDRFLSGLFEMIQQGINPALFEPAQTEGVGQEELVETVTRNFPTTEILTGVLMVFAVIVVIIFLTRLYRQTATATRQRDFSQVGSRERTSSLSLGQRLLNRLGLFRNWRAAGTIRRIYQDMCQAATGAGFPRGASETPYEYLKTLTEVWPENTSDSQLITQAYVKIRYGELPETEEEFNRIKEAWQRLERTPPMSLG
ncbi:MAG: DUF4129 domain-containing protein [Anaerolineales bacterium]|nr:DUF4129 domain-containing protein [Anaerolineales bacterium]